MKALTSNCVVDHNAARVECCISSNMMPNMRRRFHNTMKVKTTCLQHEVPTRCSFIVWDATLRFKYGLLLFCGQREMFPVLCLVEGDSEGEENIASSSCSGNPLSLIQLRELAEATKLNRNRFNSNNEIKKKHSKRPINWPSYCVAVNILP